MKEDSFHHDEIHTLKNNENNSNTDNINHSDITKEKNSEVNILKKQPHI